MLSAIQETLSELWNMKDPNAGPNPFRVSHPKKKVAIRRYLGLSSAPKTVPQTVPQTAPPNHQNQCHRQNPCCTNQNRQRQNLKTDKESVT